MQIASLFGPPRSRTTIAKRKVIHQMIDEGLLVQFRVDSAWWITRPGWRPTDELMLRWMLDKCKMVGDCLLWTGRKDHGAPVFYIPMVHKTITARREVYRIQYGRAVGSNKEVRTLCGHSHCLQLDHMVVSHRGGQNKGKRMPEYGRITLERKRRAASKLTIEIVREIRRVSAEEMEGSETWTRDDHRTINRAIDIWLGAKYGMSERTIRVIRKGVQWRETTGMFSGLLR